MITTSALNTTLAMLFAANTSAAQLLPILETYPRCDYKVKQNISAVSKLGSRERDVNDKRDEVLKNALSQLQKNASGKGDALILQKVIGQLSTDRTSYTHQSAETEIIYRLEADIIELCAEDTSKPASLTPYNAEGHRQLNMATDNTTAVKMVFSTTVGPRKAKQTFKINNSDISFINGYHGASLGSNRQQIEALFGQPDSFFQYEDNFFTLAYGNQLWLNFSDNKLVQIAHESSAFTYQLTGQIDADHNPVLTNWQLDNRFTKRNLLSDLKAYYAEDLHHLSDNEFILQQRQAIIRLKFNQYSNLSSTEQEIKLADVSFESSGIPLLPPLQLPAIQQINTLARQAGIEPLQKAGWTKMFSNLPVANYSSIREQKQLKLYRPELAAVFSDTGLSEVQFSLLTQSASLTALQQLLTMFSLPTTKQQFIVSHADAFETSSKLVVYLDTMEINATFADDDVIDSLTLKWF